MTNLTITTSVALSSAEKNMIEKHMSTKYGSFTTSYHIDDAIIGGIIIFDGDKVYDGSIRTQLNSIKETIIKQKKGSDSK